MVSGPLRAGTRTGRHQRASACELELNPRVTPGSRRGLWPSTKSVRCRTTVSPAVLVLARGDARRHATPAAASPWRSAPPLISRLRGPRSGNTATDSSRVENFVSNEHKRAMQLGAISACGADSKWHSAPLMRRFARSPSPSITQVHHGVNPGAGDCAISGCQRACDSLCGRRAPGGGRIGQARASFGRCRTGAGGDTGEDHRCTKDLHPWSC